MRLLPLCEAFLHITVAKDGFTHPSAWEVPLQPLPKRHKAHWDPIESEILLMNYN